MTSSTPCPICGSSSLQEYYKGPVRTGRFGSRSTGDRTVLKCSGCGAAHLPGDPIDYQSDYYRDLVDGSGDPATYHSTHDGEQAGKLALVGTTALRGCVVADIGAGAGSFLDVVKGMAAQTIAIEPTRSFHEALRKSGHHVFHYGSDALQLWEGRVDLAVCFSVVEHVEDPLGLLTEIRRLLRPGGRAVISTPNRKDWLLELLPEDYGSFFYRVVHRWYFDSASLAFLADKAGFSNVSVRHIHRFDLSNFFLWLRDRKPSGTAALNVPCELDSAFRASLEASGRADYLYATMEVS